tara:strand:+ start:366 stop:650 length:285 start_codon:yes stop_codon:yes gene_type:complete
MSDTGNSPAPWWHDMNFSRRSRTILAEMAELKGEFRVRGRADLKRVLKMDAIRKMRGVGETTEAELLDAMGLIRRQRCCPECGGPRGPMEVIEG